MYNDISLSDESFVFEPAYFFHTTVNKRNSHESRWESILFVTFRKSSFWRCCGWDWFVSWIGLVGICYELRDGDIYFTNRNRMDGKCFCFDSVFEVEIIHVFSRPCNCTEVNLSVFPSKKTSSNQRKRRNNFFFSLFSLIADRYTSLVNK